MSAISFDTVFSLIKVKTGYSHLHIQLNWRLITYKHFSV